MARFFERFDLLLTPTLPCPPFAVGLDQPGSVAGRPTEYLSWTQFTYPFNASGQPAASVPCGMLDGLPVGLQIVGRPGDDRLVLRAAAAFEAAWPWPAPPDHLLGLG
jgi:aspartyl-tRNA(Asn)/glutamyl-tRNA(Gln) amidotransferase subunit A